MILFGFFSLEDFPSYKPDRIHLLAKRYHASGLLDYNAMFCSLFKQLSSFPHWFSRTLEFLSSLIRSNKSIADNIVFACM